MRNFTVILVCLVLPTAGFNTQAQEKKWEWINPRLNGNQINNINIVPETKMLVVSYDDALLVSDDEGLLWASLPMDHKISNVFRFSSELSFGVSKEGEIVKGVLNGTQKIVFAQPGHNAKFYDIYMDVESGIGLAAGGYEVWQPVSNGTMILNWGVIVRTVDFGEHWEVVHEAEGDELKGLAYHNGTFTAYGTERYNYAVQSTDGISWAANDDFGLGSMPIQKIVYVTDLVGFMTYDSHGNLYYTTNGGQSWQLRKDFDKATYRMSASDSTIVVSTYSSVFISGDRGVTWTEKKITPNAMNVTGLVNKGNFIAAVDQGNGISVSRDKGYNFVNVNDNMERWVLNAHTTYSLFWNHITFTSSQVGYAPLNRSNYSSQLWKTTDGGCNWNPLPNFPGYSNTGLIHFLNDRTGFVITSGLHRTTDGGSTWTKVTLPWGASFGKMGFFTANVGVALSSEEFWRTTDGGITWTEIDHPPVGYGSTFKLFILNETAAFACSNEDIVMKTLDGGLTWTRYSTGFPLDWSALHFFDVNNGIVAGREAFFENNEWVMKRYLVRTTNGGTSWTKGPDLPDDPTGMKFVSPTEGYLIGGNGLLMKTTDGGVSWQREKTIITQKLENIFIFDDDMFLTGDRQTVAKTSSLEPVAYFELPVTTLCQGDTITAINGSEHSQSYLWKINGVEVSREKNLHAYVQDWGNVVVQLASGTCNLSRYDVASAPLNVFKQPAKPLLFINEKPASDHNIICDSTYTVTTQSYPSYKWSNGKTSPEIVLDDEENLSLTVFSEQGCPTLSDTANFTRQSRPVAEFSVDYDGDTEDVLFINESAGATSFRWNLGDGTTSTETDVRHQYWDRNKTYDISLIASGYCGSDTVARAIDYDIILSAGDYGNEKFDIYPNPLRGGETVQISDVPADHYAIGSASGSSLSPVTPLRDSLIRFPTLQPGIYLLYLYNGKKTIATKKVLVFE